MGRKTFIKIVGKISNDIVKKYRLYDYKDREIIQSLDLYAHVYKHINEFKNIDSYNHAVSSISDIINKPRFVYYDRNRNSLLYFKKIDENVCAVVKLNLRKNKDIYVSTVYPTSEKKIQKYV